MRKRILALVLTLCMALILLPTAACAADSDFVIEDGVLTKYNGPGGDVVIPDGVAFIGRLAFNGCTSLTSVTIPNSVLEIGASAFDGCTGLTSVTIPDGVTVIWYGAFRDCTGLTSVTIPDSVTTIEKNAFYGCTGLTSVTIPNGVASIGDEAFKDCTDLTKVTIPYSVTKIGGMAFKGTPWLKDQGEFAIVNGILLAYQGKGGAVTIPSGVTSIGIKAFADCTSLTSVTIPDSVTEIGPDAFYRCTGLISVTIPDSVTTIWGGVFDETPWQKNQGEFAIVNGILFDYQGKGGAVTIPSGVTSIGIKAFYGCTGLTSVTIPNSVTSIGDYAFYDCTSMTSVTIPNSITIIGTEAFEGCTSLTSVTIPSSVTSIGDYAFYNCTSMTSVTIPHSITKIGREVFYRCTGLTSVTIPGSVTSIWTGAFANCTSLTSVTIPSSVTNIRKNAFFGCTGVKDVYYSGSQTQWNSIIIGESNEPLKNATIHYNSPMPDTPTTPTTDLPTVEQIPAAGTAVARPQTVKLDGRDVQFQYYAVKDAKGNESNYVKIRDLASALNGTKAQFDVGWDGKITITPNTAYKVVGGEGTTPYSGEQSYTAVSDIPVSFNGSSVKLTSFQIKDSAGNGYTYYKLRDLGQLLNFSVTWNGGVVIETDKPYSG